MKGNFFQSFVCLVLFVSMICLGTLLCLLPTEPTLAFKLGNALLNHPELFFKPGLLLALSGCALFVFFYWMNRGGYYYCELEPKLKISIGTKVLKRGINEMLKKLEPSQKIPFRLNIYNQNIELITDLSKISFDRHEEFLERLEPMLQELFEKKYGSPNKLKVSIQALKN